MSTSANTAEESKKTPAPKENEKQKAAVDWDEDEDDDEDYFDTYGEEFDMDEEEMISFLNEYYLIYPNRLPNTQLY